MVKGTSHDKNPHKITIGTFEPSNWTNLGGHDESGRCKKIRSSPFDPPQKKGGVMGVVCFGRFFFFLKVPVPSTSWEVGNLEVEKREDERRMCWAYLLPSGQLVEATRIVRLIHWVEDSRQSGVEKLQLLPSFEQENIYVSKKANTTNSTSGLIFYPPNWPIFFGGIPISPNKNPLEVTFLALQEPDIKDTFVVVKGESSRVAPGSCCSICGERVEIMKEHVTWTLRMPM